MIRLENVSRRHPDSPRPALNDVSFAVEPGEFVFLVGASGSGKSTCLRLLLREDRPTSGRVTVLGRDLGTMPAEDVPYLRRRIGTVFQDFRLLPGRTVAQNLSFALHAVGRSPAYVEQVIPEALALVGLDGVQDRLPRELSGGEQQRVAIARAIAGRPRLLLADEPTGHLDPVASAGIVELLARINAQGTTVVMATHEAAIVDGMQQRVLELADGVLVRDERGGGYRALADPPPDAEEARNAEEAPPRPVVRASAGGAPAAQAPPGVHPPAAAPDAVGGAHPTDAVPAAGRRSWRRELDPVRRRLIVAEALAELVRSAPAALAVVLVTLVSLTFVAAAVLLQLQLDKTKDFWRDRAQVAIYLCADGSATGACAAGAATEEQTTAVRARLESDALAPFVERTRFQSSEQAYRQALSWAGDAYAASLSPADANALFLVTLADPAQAEVIVEAFSGLDGVEEVTDQLAYLAPIFSGLAIATTVAGALAAVALIAAVLLMATTIRLSVHTRRREVQIMRSVGTSDLVVRAPFVVEGMLAAVLGAVLATVVVYALVDGVVHGRLEGSIAFVGSWVGAPELLIVLPGIVVLGAALAAASTTVAVRRWLRA